MSLPAAETAAAATKSAAATTSAAAVAAAATTSAAAITAAAATTGTTAEAAAASTTASAARAALAAGTAANKRWLAGQEAFTLQLLAGEFAGAADSLRLFASSLFRRLFEMAAKLHFAENALALQLFLQRLESLIDIVVANENLQAVVSFDDLVDFKTAKHVT